MPKILDVYPPLQQICKNAQADPQKVADAVKELSGEKISPATVVSFLRRGTRNIDYLEAVAKVTGIPLKVISEAGKKTAN